MNKLGRFWAKNTTHILGLFFLGWAIWACLHWASLCLVQKLVGVQGKIHSGDGTGSKDHT